MSEAVLVVLRRGKHFLMVERKQDLEFYPRFWAPIHGHLKDGEAEEDCVKRLVKRDVSLDVRPIKKLKTVLADYGATKLHCWLASIKTGKPKLNSEKLVKCKWFTWTEAIEKELVPAAKGLFKNEIKDLVLDKSGGKFIVLDGIDASGKKTQSDLLHKWFNDLGFVANKISFPRYDTQFGKRIGEYLRGEFGGLNEVPPEVTVLLYAIDRYNYAPHLKKGLKKGEWFIADRYTPANIFQVAKTADKKEQDSLFEWLNITESRMPHPDVVIILKQDPHIARELHEQRNLETYMKSLKRDIHDEDLDYQKQVMDAFMRFANKMPNWYVVDCISEGKLRTVEEIQADIKSIVKMVVFN